MERRCENKEPTREELRKVGANGRSRQLGGGQGQKKITGDDAGFEVGLIREDGGGRKLSGVNFS